MFQHRRVSADIARPCAHAHVRREVLVDVYHSLAVLPVDVAAADVDFAVGGSYKVPARSPGACFLHVAPRWPDGGCGRRHGWFAKDSPLRSPAARSAGICVAG